jgi:hypothetical protein
VEIAPVAVLRFGSLPALNPKKGEEQALLASASNDEDAPIPDVPTLAPDRGGSTQGGSFAALSIPRSQIAFS